MQILLFVSEEAPVRSIFLPKNITDQIRSDAGFAVYMAKSAVQRKMSWVLAKGEYLIPWFLDLNPESQINALINFIQENKDDSAKADKVNFASDIIKTSELKMLCQQSYGRTISDINVLGGVSTFFGVDEWNDMVRLEKAIEIMLYIDSLSANDKTFYLNKIVGFLKNFTSTASGGQRYMPLALAVTNQFQGKNIFDQGEIGNLIGIDSRFDYLINDYNLYGNPDGVGAEWIPKYMPSLILPTPPDKTQYRWLDIGSAPKANGASTLNITKNALEQMNPGKQFQFVGTDLRFPAYIFDGTQITLSQFQPENFSLTGAINVGGVTYLDASIPQNDVLSDQFDQGKFDFISFSMVLYRLSTPPLPPEDTILATDKEWIDNNGNPLVSNPLYNLTLDQQNAIANLLTSLEENGGMLFMSVPPTSERRKDNTDLYLIIRREGVSMYRLYTQAIPFMPNYEPLQSKDFLMNPRSITDQESPGIRGLLPNLEEGVYEEIEEWISRADVLAYRYQSLNNSVWLRVKNATALINQGGSLRDIFATYMAGVPDTEHLKGRILNSITLMDAEISIYRIANETDYVKVNAAVQALNAIPQSAKFLEYGVHFVSQDVLDKIAQALPSLETGGHPKGLHLQNGVILILESLSEKEKIAVYIHEINHAIFSSIFNNERQLITDIVGDAVNPGVLTDQQWVSLAGSAGITVGGLQVTLVDIQNDTTRELRTKILNEAMAHEAEMQYLRGVAVSVNETQLENIRSILQPAIPNPALNVLYAGITFIVYDNNLIAPRILDAVAAGDVIDGPENKLPVKKFDSLSAYNALRADGKLTSGKLEIAQQDVEPEHAEGLRKFINPIAIAGMPDGTIVAGERGALAAGAAIYKPDGTSIPLRDENGNIIGDITSGEQVTQVAVDEIGDIFVVTAKGIMRRYSSEGVLMGSRDISGGTGTAQVQGMVVHQNKIYYTEMQSGQLRILDLTSGEERVFGGPEAIGPFVSTREMQLSINRQTGLLYITDSAVPMSAFGFSGLDSKARIRTFDIASETFVKSGEIGGLGIVAGIAIDDNGTVYIGDRDRNVIHVGNADGIYQGYFYCPTPVDGPLSGFNIVGLDSDGNVLIAGQGVFHRISKDAISSILVKVNADTGIESSNMPELPWGDTDKNISSGTIDEAKHEQFNQLLLGQFNGMRTAYNTIVPAAAKSAVASQFGVTMRDTVPAGELMTELEADIALVFMGYVPQGEFMMLQQLRRIMKSSPEYKAAVAKKEHDIPIFFTPTGTATELYWVDDDYSAGHFSADGSKIYVSLSLASKDAHALLLHGRQALSMGMLSVGAARHEFIHIAKNRHDPSLDAIMRDVAERDTKRRAIPAPVLQAVNLGDGTIFEFAAVSSAAGAIVDMNSLHNLTKQGGWHSIAVNVSNLPADLANMFALSFDDGSGRRISIRDMLRMSTDEIIFFPHLKVFTQNGDKVMYSVGHLTFPRLIDMFIRPGKRIIGVGTLIPSDAVTTGEETDFRDLYEISHYILRGIGQNVVKQLVENGAINPAYVTDNRHYNRIAYMFERQFLIALSESLEAAYPGNQSIRALIDMDLKGQFLAEAENMIRQLNIELGLLANNLDIPQDILTALSLAIMPPGGLITIIKDNADPLARAAAENALKHIDITKLPGQKYFTIDQAFFNNYEGGTYAAADYVAAGEIVIIKSEVTQVDSVLAEGLAESFFEVKKREDAVNGTSYISNLMTAGGFADEATANTGLAAFAKQVYETYKSGGTLTNPLKDIFEIRQYFEDLAVFIQNNGISTDPDTPTSFNNI